MLKGQSQFKLELIKNAEGFFMKKSSKNGLYAPRLLAQCKKQIEFRNAILNDCKMKSLFEIPEVLEQGFNYFLMPFYRGKSVLDIFEKGDISFLNEMVNKIFLFIDWEFKKCIYTKDVKRDILEKLNSLMKKIYDMRILNIIESLIKIVDNSKLIIVPVGVCHGDFTLSNFIFSNKIILIDFLDSFVESPIQDIAKLLQELKLRWTLKMSQTKRDVTKIKISYEHLSHLIEQKIDCEFYKYLAIINLFYKITLLRIVPYLSENSPHVEEIIKKLEE